MSLSTNPEKTHPITTWLENASSRVFTTYAACFAFLTYFCMYAFRKPFSVATFENLNFFGSHVEIKTAIVLSQIVGYTVSKFIGIRVCSELDRKHRARAIVGLIAASELALLGFAAVPFDWKIIPIFLNGLCLGMIWGLVVSYLEGRKASEILLAALSCSYIVSSGIVKDLGRWTLSFGVSESWMPFVTALPFFILLIVVVYFLDKIPPPNMEDIGLRVKRTNMNSEQRWRFIRQFGFGVFALTFVYFFITAYRDFRDIYGQEIFEELGHGETPGIFSLTELPIAFGVMSVLALISLILKPRQGLRAVFAMLVFGLTIVGVATLLFDLGLIGGVFWMILVGLGAYLAYVPFGSVLFDRVIAATRFSGTAVFAIYVADAIGYSGSVALQLYKDFFASDATRLDFFRGYSYFLVLFGVIGVIASAIYFDRLAHKEKVLSEVPKSD